jgi:hypothetical protein
LSTIFEVRLVELRQLFQLPSYISHRMSCGAPPPGARYHFKQSKGPTLPLSLRLRIPIHFSGSSLSEVRL